MHGAAASSSHTVLAEADGAPYRSLRHRPVTRAERYALGKSLRKRVPRKSLGDWTAPADRPDPVELINVSHHGRVDWLIPIRVGRMAASPYGFLRGTAVVMAEDVAHLPATGITPVICGDAHLGNFGFYASPERDLVIDLNDFDEAHPGGWEWDLRRLVASIWVAGPPERRLRTALCAIGSASVRRRPTGHELRRPRRRCRCWHGPPVGSTPTACSRADGQARCETGRAVGQRARRRTGDRALPASPVKSRR